MKNLAKFLLIASLISLVNASNENECNGGKASACFSVAKEYDKDENTNKAIEFYKKACELNYAIGCNKVGEKYLNLKNNEYAKMFFSKACALNHHESCVSYGEIFENEGNCDMASEIYKDTFKNKKFKPAQSKFEALIGSEKCMSEELKKQKEEGEKAKAEVEKAKGEIESAKAEIESSKKELEAQKQKLESKTVSTAALLQKIFTRDMLEAKIEYLEQFTGIAIDEVELEAVNKTMKRYKLGKEECYVEATIKNGKILSLGLVPDEKCTVDLFNMAEGIGHISANKLTIGYLFDKFGENNIIYESNAGCGVMQSPKFIFDAIYTAVPHPRKKIGFKAIMDDTGGAEKLLKCSNMTFGKDFYPGIMAMMFKQKYNKIINQKLKNKRPFRIEMGYGLFDSVFD